MLAVLFSLAAVAAEPSCIYKSGAEKVVYRMISPKEAVLHIDGPAGKFECQVEVYKTIDLRRAVEMGVRSLGDRTVACSPAGTEFEKNVLRDITLDVTVYDGKPRASINVFRRRGFEKCELSNYSASGFGLPVQPSRSAPEE